MRAGPKAHPGWTLAVVCTAIFMLILDVTVVSVALGSIQADFDASLADLQWVVDAYTLPLAGLLLTAATLGDRLGRRRVFLVGLVVFTVGSLGCALSGTATELDLIRVVQGIGAALLFGTALPLLGAAFVEPRKRAGAIGAFGATLGGALAVGPLLGGALVDGPGWRWIFLLNLPIGVVAVLVTATRLGESRPEHPRRADWPGTVLLTASLFALLLGLIRGNTDGWGSARIVALLAGAAVLAIAFVVRESRAADPMLDLSLFARPTFTGISVAVFAVSATAISACTYLGLYLINTLGYSPWEAGLRFLPMTVASFVAAPIAARFSHRVAPRWLIGGSLASVAVGMALVVGLDGDSGWGGIAPGFVLAGLGLGAVGAVTAQVALAAVEPDRAGMATGAVNTARQLGVAAGVAVLGALFQGRVPGVFADRLAVSGVSLPPGAAKALGDAVAGGAGVRVVPSGPEASVLTDAIRAASESGLNLVLTTAAVAAAIAAVAATVLIRDASGEADRVHPPLSSGDTSGRERPVAERSPAGR
jgi:EmrB/QacA subfamily drug resistance transporter